MLVLAVGRQLLFHGEGHAQVWRELVPQFAGEDFRVDLRADDADGRLREHVRQVGPCGHAILVFGGDVRLLLAAGARQVGIAFVDPGADFACRVRSGHELHAQRFRQRLDHADDQLVQQSWHIPRELFRSQSRQCFQRHMHGDAVVWVVRVVDVAQP